MDKVADMEVDMLADMEVDTVADIDMEIQFGESWSRGMLNWAQTSTQSLPGLRICKALRVYSCSGRG